MGVGMAIVLVVLGIVVGLASAMLAWSLGLGIIWVLFAYLVCGQAVIAAVLLVAARISGRRPDRPDPNIEDDLRALRESQLRDERMRAGSPDALQPVLFRALRTQEQARRNPALPKAAITLLANK